MQLGTLFLADAPILRDVTFNTQPLTDNYPKRLLSSKKTLQENVAFYYFMMEQNSTRERFEKSNFIDRIWPEQLREETLEYFDYQGIRSEAFIRGASLDKISFNDLHKILIDTYLESLPLWILDSNYIEQSIVSELIEEDSSSPEIFPILAKQAISQRDYQAAINHIEEYLNAAPVADSHYVYPLYIYTLSMNGSITKANILSNRLFGIFGTNETYIKYFEWMQDTFGLEIQDL